MHPLEQLIRQHVHFTKPADSRGWHGVLCRVCNDHGRKGPRAGFKFDSEGIGYNCFNCVARFVVKPDQTSVSKRAIDILECYGISQSDIQNCMLDFAKTFSLEHHMQQQTAQKVDAKAKEYEPQTIHMPSDFHPITGDSEWELIAKDYLERRSITNVKDFMWCSGLKTKNYLGRLIIPFFKNGKLIYYSGRDMLDVHPRKYLNPPVQRSNVMWGFDRLFEHSREPLYVFEGVFDACLFPNGVAVLSNDLTPGHVYWLNKSQRPKVVIPDRFGNGHILAQHAVDNNWSVAFPDIGTHKDISEALPSMGSMYIKRSIIQNTIQGFEAEAQIAVLCSERTNTNLL